MTTSTIDTSVPATNAPLASAPVRNNFVAAANDINALWATVSSSRVYNVLDYGATGNGTTNDRAAIQSVLDMADGVNTFVMLIPAGNYKIGSDTTPGLESPLTYKANTIVVCYGKLLHYINNSFGALIHGNNRVSTTEIQNVYFIFEGPGGIVFPTRTLSTERKGLLMTYVRNFGVYGINITGDDHGSFSLQLIGCSYGHVSDCVIKSGDSVGEDGIHLTQNCNNITFSDMIIYAGDDAFSITHEGSVATGKVIENLTIANSIIYTDGNSSFKALIDSSATNAIIRNILVSNCYFGVQGNNATGGNLVISTPSTDNGSLIYDIDFVNCIFDADGGPNNSNSMSVSGNTANACSNINFYDCTLKNIPGRGINLQRLNKFRWIGGYIQHALPDAPTLTGTINAITFVSGTTLRAFFDGSPDLSPWVSPSAQFITISGAAIPGNNGVFSVTTANNTTKTVDYSVSFSNGSSANNETGLVAPVALGRRFSSSMEMGGGSDYLIDGVVFDRPATYGIRLITSGGAGTDGAIIRNCTFTNCQTLRAIDMFTCANAQVYNNQGFDNSANYFIALEIATANTGNVIYGNRDIDNSFKDSFFITDDQCNQWGNKGTNSDFKVGTVDLLSGGTSVNIDLSRSAYGVYANVNILPGDIVVYPTEDVGKRWWVTTDSASRRYVIRTDSAVGSDITFSYNIRKYPS